jgi:hypothetical protein
MSGGCLQPGQQLIPLLRSCLGLAGKLLKEFNFANGLDQT